MQDNPYESPDTADSSVKPSSSRPGLRIFGFVLGAMVILGLLISMMLPATRRVPSAARRNGCLNNLRQISLAIRNYEAEHGTLPPAYPVDDDGNRLHSWRTLILPYIEEQTLYESIDFTKPWDHPDNATARDAIVVPYVCPSGRWDDETKTTYLAVEGPGCCFNGSTPVALESITDGESRTAMIVEVDEDHALHWMDPRDADEKLFCSISPESMTSHSRIMCMAFVDCHARSISVDIDRELRQAAMTIAGGEEWDINDF